MNERPDPDELLARVQAEDDRAARGRLKIFLGYAAGVGKTFAMLEAAHQRRAEGVDVVIGYVETHGRVETESLLARMEVVPRREVSYRGVTLTEMDVDALVARRPHLAIVDELAHTNVPESRHPKRYLDVEELLDVGIDVYTTLNVQHLESLNDVVAQITGTRQRETIPDRVIDEASEIEMVDLPPDELLRRLRDGKVYVPDQAARAIQQFFRKGNLTALREMALRRAAERVDGQMRAYMETRAIPGPWHAAERLVVCVGASSLSEKLVRSARRLADELNAPWYAIHFESAARPELDGEKRERVTRALHLAESLGGQAISLTGESLPETILSFARKHNVTKIVVGARARPRWRDNLRVALVEDLIRHSGDIDVYVISHSSPARPAPRARPPVPRGWGSFALSLGFVAAATAIGLLLRGRIEPTNLVMLYLTAVLLSALRLGRAAAAVSALTGVLAFDFFMVPPYLSFAVSDTQYLLTFLVLFVVGLVVGDLAARARDQAVAAISRESQTAALYELGRALTSAPNLETIVQTLIEQTSRVFARAVIVFLPDAGVVRRFAASPGDITTEHDLAVVTWAFEHDQPAGRGTDTLPAASLRCLPMTTPRGPVGVLGVRPAPDDLLLTDDQRRTLASFANQAALAIERAQLAEQARRAELLQATEKLQTALLNSISHDLRTPLVSITGALTTLEGDDAVLDAETRRSLISTAREESERLNRLVANLLSMTRLEAGAVRLALQPADIEDAIGSALEMLGPRTQGRQIMIRVAPALPLVMMDFVLVVQVLVNLLDNALKYAPPDMPIEIEAAAAGELLRVDVLDRGPGIPSGEKDRIFDKFYRFRQSNEMSGTGLGLSICKGIIEAHTGRIEADMRPGGGMRVSFWLPFPHKAAKPVGSS